MQHLSSMQEIKQEKSPIKQRILQYLDIKGITKYEFYKKTGITRGVLDQNTGISEDNIARFIAYDSTINLEWLICGIGNIYKNIAHSEVEKQDQEHNNLSQKDEIVNRLTQECNYKGNRIIELMEEVCRLREEINKLKKSCE